MILSEASGKNNNAATGKGIFCFFRRSEDFIYAGFISKQIPEDSFTYEKRTGSVSCLSSSRTEMFILSAGFLIDNKMIRCIYLVKRFRMK